jgi:uncharacterized membrane protein
MRVARSHVAAIVDTLVLAYLGASLPLLLLFALSGESPLTIVNGEIVAVEVVRALLGSIGIVAAVPITTLVAAWLLVPGEKPLTERRARLTARRRHGRRQRQHDWLSAIG